MLQPACRARRLPLRHLISLALLQAFCLPALASEAVEFDLSTLRDRGIDPKLAAQFKDAPRFLAGEHTISLTVNGKPLGRAKVRFNEAGEPCFDRALLKLAGIAMPGSLKQGENLDLHATWPQAEINTDPGDEKLELIVPPEAITAVDSSSYEHGGIAGLLNYDANYMDSAGKYAGVNFMQFGSEAGFNISDWIVRSRQTFQRFNGEASIRHQGAYAQRSFTESKKVFQAGQINLVNSMFGSGQVLGAQLFPETALENKGGAGLVEGIADSASVVEVHQSGALIYSTTVPAGPFRLQGFSLLNTRSDLNVTVTDSQGGKRQFIVPATSLPASGARAPGFAAGIGKVEQNGSGEAPWVATASRGWILNPYNMLTAGTLVSRPWRAVGFTLNSQPFSSSSLQLETSVAEDHEHQQRGAQITANASQQLVERVSVSANALRQTRGYREMSDALQSDYRDNSGTLRDQFGAGIGWSLDAYGTLSFGWARSRSFDGSSTHYLRAGWNKSFERAWMSVNIERDSGGRYNDPEQRIYLTLNVPFGDVKNFSSYLNNSSRNGSRAGVRYSDRYSQDRGYALSSERDFRYRRDSVTGTMDMVTPVSQLGGSLTRNSDGNTNWSMRASGGLALHGGGVTLTPYRVSDTFAIAKVGDERGVRLETPGGPTWTDGRGYAVIPSLRSYEKSTVQIDTRSLQKNVDIVNALQEASAARGAVSYLAFDVVRTRRVLVDVKDSKGQPLPYGASVFDRNNLFVTAVGKDGAVFLPDAGEGGKMDVQVSGETLCSFDLQLPEKPREASLYETAAAQCS